MCTLARGGGTDFSLKKISLSWKYTALGRNIKRTKGLEAISGNKSASTRSQRLATSAYPSQAPQRFGRTPTLALWQSVPVRQHGGIREGPSSSQSSLTGWFTSDLVQQWVWASTESRHGGRSKGRHKAFLNQGPSFLHRQIDLYNRSWATNWSPAPSSTETSNLKSSISHNREFGGACRDSIFSPRRHPLDCDVDQLGNSNEDHLSMKKRWREIQLSVFCSKTSLANHPYFLPQYSVIISDSVLWINY